MRLVLAIMALLLLTSGIPTPGPSSVGSGGIGPPPAEELNAPPPLTLLYPRYPGVPTSGDSLYPTVNCLAGLFDFNKVDYQGWGTTANDRIRWASDPLGTGRVVTKFILLDGDVATQFGGQRSQIWQAPNTHQPGSEAWFAFGWLFPQALYTPFKCPLTELTLCSMSSTGTITDVAPQAIVVRNCATVNSVGDLALSVRQTSPASPAVYYTIGPATRDVWHYVVMHIIFNTSGAGTIQLWHEQAIPPNVALSPDIEVPSVNTIFPAYGSGYPVVGMARTDGGATEYPETAFLWGYGRGTNAAEAMTNAAIPSPPPVILRPTSPAALGDTLGDGSSFSLSQVNGRATGTDSSTAVWATVIDDLPGAQTIDSLRFHAVAFVGDIGPHRSVDTCSTWIPNRPPITRMQWVVGSDSAYARIAYRGDLVFGSKTCAATTTPDANYILDCCMSNSLYDGTTAGVVQASHHVWTAAITTQPNGSAWTTTAVNALSNVSIKYSYRNGDFIYAPDLTVAEIWVEVFWR